MFKWGKFLAACASAGMLATSAHAIVVTGTLNANTLAAAVTAGNTGIIVTNASVQGHQTTSQISAGTFTNASNNYDLGAGIVITTGDAGEQGDASVGQFGSTTAAYGVAATAAQQPLLNPLTTPFTDHFDVTQLDITFDMLPGYDTIFFNVVFTSYEWPVYVGAYVDGFGLYVNGVNIALVGGLPVNIDHPDMTDNSTTNNRGILEPGGNPILTFSQFVGDGSTGNTITFIVADTNDAGLDTTAYISALGGTPPPPVPEPGTLCLWGVGLGGMLVVQRRRARR